MKIYTYNMCIYVIYRRRGRMTFQCHWFSPSASFYFLYFLSSSSFFYFFFYSYTWSFYNTYIFIYSFAVSSLFLFTHSRTQVFNAKRKSLAVWVRLSYRQSKHRGKLKARVTILSLFLFLSLISARSFIITLSYSTTSFVAPPPPRQYIYI